MTDHKFTDEALVSKLGEMTTGGHCCDDCSYAEFPHPACKQLIMDQAYDLINRQRAEIKMLTENSISTKYPNHVLCSKGVILTKSLEDYDKLISDISAEAIKEFAERLKEWAYSGYSRRAIPECVFVSVEQINDLVEEMTEGKPCTEGRGLLHRGGRGMTHHPCSRDCPRRSSECHSVCPEWAEWERERNAEYERRAAERAAECAFYDSKVRTKLKNYRRSGEWRK